MVRWVFRPYTQVRRQRFARQFRTTQASTKFSPGFTMSEHSSPSFGSQLICSLAWLIFDISHEWQIKAYVRDRAHVRNQPVLHSYCNKTKELAQFCFRFAVKDEFIVNNSTTRNPVELLGPCFKTGRIVAPRFIIRWNSIDIECSVCCIIARYLQRIEAKALCPIVLRWN